MKKTIAELREQETGATWIQLREPGADSSDIKSAGATWFQLREPGADSSDIKSAEDTWSKLLKALEA